MASNLQHPGDMGTPNYSAILKEAYEEWSRDKAPRLGAALAYYAVFSIPPMLLILIAIASTVYHGNVAGSLEAQFAALISPEAAHEMFAVASKNSHKSGVVAEVVGFILLFLGASGVFGELKDALNTIWRARPKSRKGIFGYLTGTFLSFSMVLGSVFLLLVSLVFSALLTALGHRLQTWMPGQAALFRMLDIGISFVLITVIFAVMYRYVPDLKLRWNDVWIGAAATAALFTVGKYAIGLYLGKAAVGVEYGAAGSVIVFIVWVYYSAQIFYMGAEFTKVYARRHGSQSRMAEAA